MYKEKKKLLIIAGPTATGKTAVSVELAKKIGGEIISADSMQVYKDMDIGSAKITENEKKGVPHYLIDILSPKDDFNITLFQSMAKEAMSCIYEKGKIPLIVGGTGFYIQSVLYDIAFDQSASKSLLREELEKEYDTKGAEYIHQKLKTLDFAAAEKIHKNNKKRLIRAIEYVLSTGEKISEHNEKERQKESPYEFYYFVLHTSRDLLYQRTDQRVDKMMEAGLLDEVRRLKAMGLGRKDISMQGLGYKEILAYLEGDISLDRAIYLIKRDTRHFAKRQLTWFRREKNAIWIDIKDFSDPEQIAEYLHLSYLSH